MPLRSYRTALIAIALGLACPASARGQEAESLVTDRPTFTPSGSTVAPGRFQVEAGYTFSKAGDQEQHNFGELVARIGVVSWFEARLGINSYALLRAPADDQSGFEGLGLGAKFMLYRKPEGSSTLVPQVALLAGTDLPTGSDEFGPTAAQPAAVLVLDFALGAGFDLTSSVGWAYLESDGSRFNQGTGSAVLSYSISDPLTGFVEWYGLFPENRAGGSNHYVNGGLGWLVSPNVQLDWRIGLGLQDPDPNWFTGIGISFRL